MLSELIFNPTVPFEERALQVFAYQYHHTPVYQEFCDYLGRTSETVRSMEQIPFLPIELFKYHQILDKTRGYETIFRSSGTTGQTKSQHFVADLELYERAILQGFEQFFGSPKDYCFLALLPSYLERKDASLVYMAEYLMQCSSHPYNGFFLDNYEELNERLQKLKSRGDEVILLGVTFALLDFAEAYPQQLAHVKLIETGGMKGRRKELTRNELHRTLKEAFGVNQIYSEYGMTEMLSQAYFTANGRFSPSATLRCFAREITDPFQLQPAGKSGALNIIDLANLHGCSFIATQDVGKVYEDGSFEVLGRTDYSDLRGCNLMVL